MWSLFTVMAVLSGLGAVAVVQGAISGSAPDPLTTGQVSSELGTVNAGTPGTHGGRAQRAAHPLDKPQSKAQAGSHQDARRRRRDVPVPDRQPAADQVRQPVGVWRIVWRIGIVRSDPRSHVSRRLGRRLL